MRVGLQKGGRQLRAENPGNQSLEEVRTMAKHALKRPTRTRPLAARAVVVGTFAAISCGVVTGTAQAAGGRPVALTDTAKADTAKADTGKTAQAAKPVKYTVVRGDHLASIARSRKVPGGWPAIASANKLSSPYIIHPGDVLTLPAGSLTSASTTTDAATTADTSTAGSQSYPDNLDGWINESLAIMAQNGIPGTYDGIQRNIMRESSGDPNAINLWDSNAAAGHPSIGLLQVIQPTFDAYHVAGTSSDIYDPVANITAACNYAYHLYGSIDNVNGPY